MCSNREERLNMSIIRGREGKTVQVPTFYQWQDSCTVRTLFCLQTCCELSLCVSVLLWSCAIACSLQLQSQLEHSQLEYQSMKTQLELRGKELAGKLAETSVAHDEIKERNDERGQVIDELNRKCTELVSVFIFLALCTVCVC